VEVLASKGIATRALVRDTAKATGSAALAGLGSTTEVKAAQTACPSPSMALFCLDLIALESDASQPAPFAHRCWTAAPSVPRPSARPPQPTASAPKPMPPNKPRRLVAQVVRGDVTQFGSLPPAMDGVDAVVCCTGARDVSNPLSPFLVDFEVG
jgi:hypothetical protein